ncbi:MAG TPA: metal ABC transporter permease [Solirubrobacteraceae bacterium]|jgi:zinc/manganese transport system permease protein|nr:metal ABC transporter permease [Solirubrobacteraceae bacterium]
MTNPRLSWDLARDVSALFEYQFMVNALQAGTIVAVMAGAVGWYMVLRRQSFAGHTIAVMSFPGAAGAALAGAPAALGYYLACAIAALSIGQAGGSARDARGGESARIAVVQVAGLALGFLFLSLYSGVLEQLETLLFGTFLGIDRRQVLTLLIVAVVVLATLVLVGRPLLLSSLDPQAARARGVPVRALDVGFLLLLGLAVAATSQITGALLVFALLVAPPAAAQALTPRPGLSLLLSVAFALLVVWVGLGISYYSIYPLGFFVTSLGFGVYLLAQLARRTRVRARRHEGGSGLGGVGVPEPEPGAAA